MKYDAIIVAGDKISSRNIYYKNKAFLTIKGMPLIVHILLTLEKTQSIDRIYIVGPKEQLLEAIDRYAPHLKEAKIARVLEQKQTVYENFWYAFENIFENCDKGSLYFKNSLEYKEKAVLVVPSDIPLITADEIEYFLSNCDIGSYDYIAGVTREERLKSFYPSQNRPGIKMAYIHIKEGLYRCNNLHLIKPAKVGSAPYIEKFYECRYQKDFKNIIKLVMEILKTKQSYRGLRYYILMQLSLFFSSIHMNTISSFLRRSIPMNSVEQCISDILKTRFKAICVPYPGAALDVDNEKNYRIMDAMFDKWKKYLSTHKHSA